MERAASLTQCFTRKCCRKEWGTLPVAFCKWKAAVEAITIISVREAKGGFRSTSWIMLDMRWARKTPIWARWARTRFFAFFIRKRYLSSYKMKSLLSTGSVFGAIIFQLLIFMLIFFLYVKCWLLFFKLGSKLNSWTINFQSWDRCKCGIW